MSSLPLSRTANATSCCGGSRHRPGRAVPISSVATSSSNIHGRSSARVHLYRNSRVARYLQARRMKVAIGLYFILCVTLSALLFTWTIMSTVDQQQQLQQRSNNNLRLGIASNSKSSTAMKLLQRFKRGRQNNQKILGSLGEENASASTQPQQELLQPSLQERRAAEALRIPDDEPVVQVIITR